MISAHTVKAEAHAWVRNSRWNFYSVDLYRMKDGSGGVLRKDMVKLEWELTEEEKKQSICAICGNPEEPHNLRHSFVRKT